MKQLLDAIEARNKFNAFANSFRQDALDVVGVGWSKTRERIEGQLANKDLRERAENVLRSAYENNLLYCDKYVFLWRIEPAVAAALTDALPSFLDDQSPYLKSFPYPLNEDRLRASRAYRSPSGIVDDEESSTIFFVSKRETFKEVPIENEAIPEVLKEAGYVMLLGRRSHPYQVFDSVTINPNIGLVEMRIDCAKQLSEKDAVNAREGIRAKFNKLAATVTGNATTLGDPLNLYKALSPLYFGTGWVVRHIGHCNEGGYENQNKGRHRFDDVRNDDYHAAGEEAVSNMQLWGVTAVFNAPHGAGAPTLEIEGHSRMLSSVHPHVDVVRILDCASEEDYHLVLGTLLDCLKTAEAVTTATQHAVASSAAAAI
ncbi:hypothetical protein [Jeongeupia naejangsanensis]|uniref:Uncharacterized protein n=1 Tax=Jeongeupia naejangsanensis TaxID=613195 RepID=A0ABS2BHP7_9NEIS|nr:hypothetical protein [Jeongeupia naejangsanensis]MBM3114970.1 hypothetical protein [Jeongeupia naejangsanensis]